MMDRIREGTNSLVVKIILGLIILSFVFAGVGSYIVGGGQNTAAKVGNVEIGRAEFEQAYQNERNRMQAQLGDYFATLLADPNYVETFRSSVLQRLVTDALLEQHAAELGLRVSDAQIRREILAIPEFQVDGQFDQERYQAALRRAGFNPEGFAELMRRDLVKNQLIAAVQASDFSLGNEIDTQMALFTQQREIRRINLSVDEYASKVELSEDEISQYYQDNPAQFSRPEQVKVGYLELSAQTLRDQVEVSSEEAQNYYQENLARYSTAEQREVSHILLQDSEQAEALLAQLNSGADFAELAAENSEDVGSADSGGSLGAIERDVMDPAFEEAAFALSEVGEISDIVKSDFGLHIIKLDALNPGVAKPFDAVEAEITEQLTSDKAVERFYELLNDLETVAFEFPDSLDDASQAVGVASVTTDFVAIDALPSALSHPEVIRALESPEVKEDGLNSSAIETAPEQVVVVRVEDWREQTVLPFEEVSEQAKQSLAKVRGAQQAEDIAIEVVERLQAGDESLLAEYGLSFGEPETLSRGQQLSEAVFAMPKPNEGSEFAQTVALNGDVQIVELLNVTQTAGAEFTDQLSQQISSQAGQVSITGLVDILETTYEIENYISQPVSQ